MLCIDLGAWGFRAGLRGSLLTAGNTVGTSSGSSWMESNAASPPQNLSGQRGVTLVQREVPVVQCCSLPACCPLPTGKSEVEQWLDMYTVTSQLVLKVGREDDGVPVICLVDHPAVKDLQTQRYLEVMCE